MTVQRNLAVVLAGGACLLLAACGKGASEGGSAPALLGTAGHIFFSQSDGEHTDIYVIPAGWARASSPYEFERRSGVARPFS
jgi:hypothetical protein